MKQLNCKRCGWKWNYKGHSIWYTSCPQCKTSVKTMPKKSKFFEKLARKE